MTRRVLIADDDADMRELLRLVLVGASYDVVGAAADGEMALGMWRTEREQGLCAVILDQRMPGIYGIEVAKVIQAEDPMQTIILLSAYLDADIEVRARQAGIAACVPKQDVLKFPQHPVLAEACRDR